VIIKVNLGMHGATMRMFRKLKGGEPISSCLFGTLRKEWKKKVKRCLGGEWMLAYCLFRILPNGLWN